MQELKIEYVKLSELTPYENNARKHQKEDVAAIKESIARFGMNDPIGIWGDKNIIVEGHGRMLALKELGYDTVPCIRLDALSDEERKAYALAHNRTAELSAWDEELLKRELEELGDYDIDMSLFGFGTVEELLEESDVSGTYTDANNTPQYECTGNVPVISALYEEDRVNALLEEIDGSNVSAEEKDFLRKAAYRHRAFDYRNIAEYYAVAGEEMQRLMEHSGLVIIDVNSAIANGYSELFAEIEKMRGEDANA
jgi:hypothetical protein